MSQENLDRLRKAYEAFNQVGFTREWAEEFWDPDTVWETDPSVPEPGTYEGFEAVWTYLTGFQRAFGAFHIDIKELIDLGSEDVLSVLAVEAKPLGQSGSTQWVEWSWLVTFRGDKILRIRSFFDRQAAAQAAGLSE
jgi:ketosteroid isomerase-like protein